MSGAPLLRAPGAAALAQALAVPAQASSRVGVPNDMSGLCADVAGPGSVTAERTAVEEFGGTMLGRPVEVLAGDHRNRPDLGAAATQGWYEQDGVGPIVGVPTLSVVLAVNEVARDGRRLLVVATGGISALTGRRRAPETFHHVYDTHGLAVGTAAAPTEAVWAAGTDGPMAVAARMLAAPVDARFARGARPRADGKLAHEPDLLRVKNPAERREAWWARSSPRSRSLAEGNGAGSRRVSVYGAGRDGDSGEASYAVTPAVAPLLAAGVFACVAATDAACVSFTPTVMAHRRLAAADWSGICCLLATSAVIGYTQVPVYALFAALRAWTGAFARVAWMGRERPAQASGAQKRDGSEARSTLRENGDG